MIDRTTVEEIHDILIEKFGGSKGIRDIGLLLSALARPYGTFDQKELYPTIIEKAAAIFESIIVNHPFIDGNKRVAYVTMRLVLLESGCDISATQNEKYEMTIAASKGDLKNEGIKLWIKDKLINII